jgi:hypothetical protein
MRVGVFSRNANLGKFVTGRCRLRTYNNSVVADVGEIVDPGTDSYTNTEIFDAILSGDPRQLDALQIGVQKIASGAEAADWRISTIGFEILFLQEIPPPLPSAGFDAILTRSRAIGY